MAIVAINYDEGNIKDLRYKSVNFSYGNPRQEKVFASGNFVKDWFDMRKFMIQELFETELHFSQSSSVNHFIMDGAPYDSEYLVYDEKEEKYVLKYGSEWCDKGIEFFVPEHTQPTWDELKEMCK